MEETSKAEHELNQELIKNPKEYPNLVRLLENRNRYNNLETKPAPESVPHGKVNQIFLRKHYKNIARRLGLLQYPPFRIERNTTQGGY